MSTTFSTSRSFVVAQPLLLSLLLTGCEVEQPAEPTAAVAVDYTAEPTDAPRDNAFWWPEQLDLGPLRRNTASPPYGEFDYAAAFAALDLDAVKADIEATLTDSQDWWPADYGNYGPFFVRLAWHSAGTYRASDGRGGSDGGQIRFEPLNSWPDNGNLDKARRLLLPVKQKYGRSLSWADLIVLSGNVAIESMGLKTLGFSGGRVDDWEADLVYWGPEGEMLASHDRFHGNRELDEPLGATRMGLIYVNPEGPNGNPDPLAAADDIRETFSRMGMNERDTVALIAGGHTFGKAHGAAKPADCVDEEPAGGAIEDQDLGWNNRCGTGNGADTITSGLEGAWTAEPARWTHQYFANLYAFDWVETKSPAGAIQWKPEGDAGAGLVPDAHVAGKRHQPMMFTTDLSLRQDPSFDEISRQFAQDPASFEQAFAEAWFKLIHRDLGPPSRYLGPDVPEETFTWQDPLPSSGPTPNSAELGRLADAIRTNGVDRSALVRVAWASASTFRNSDMRGGANGARIRLEPQINWAVHDDAEIRTVLDALETARSATGVDVSLADLIVLAGAVAIEDATSGSVTVPVIPGRVDATQDSTDVVSFGFLEPSADAFRNYYTDEARLSPADAMVDRAALLGLSVAETAALIGGLRVLGGNADGSEAGVLTQRPGTLSNDFFVNLLDVSTRWTPRGSREFEGRGPDGRVRWTATEVDLVFGSNAELRAISESFAHDEALFRQVFVTAWTKVMRADRFDLHR